MEQPQSNKRTPSTTWEWRKVKIERRRAAPSKRGAAGASSLPARSRREPLTLTVRHRGGPESWWEIKARGRVWRRPGYLTIDEVLIDVYRGERESPA